MLGMVWKERIYIDTALPFGLRSAPKIFNSVADALEWVMRARGVRNVAHYLDDYIVMGSPRSTECAEDLEKALTVNWKFQWHPTSVWDHLHVSPSWASRLIQWY